jgi:hypothetical protein
MRFAHRLEFGDKTHEVSMTALRLGMGANVPSHRCRIGAHFGIND